jgi:type VI secretion system protein ImpK
MFTGITTDNQSGTSNLLRLYTPIFALISTIEVSNDFGEPEKLAETALQHFASIRKTACNQGINLDWISDAQYAVVAFVDEYISRSNWHGRDVWKKRPLSTQLSLDPNQGIKFFEKLDSWRRASEPPIELLKVFYTCLGLGFRGQYFDDDDSLNSIKQDILAQLSRDGNIPELLSPNAEKPMDDPITPKSDSFPWTWVISISLGLLLVIFVILKSFSSAQINDLLKTLTR